ncbi:jacalin-related lectin 24 [Brassica rapa]|uniref:Jacalin-type lectin domain-containing protein n=1 Tax=Brassica campestris TaxID=3711 RepID=M4CKP4_BRACM|nr:jacalin-related lectin 24 [Brassica rapa]
MIRAGHVGGIVTWNRDDFAELGVEWYVPEDTEWDEKGRTMISHIYVSYDATITSIQFGYYENEALVLSERHGPPDNPGNFSTEFVTVKLVQDEYVTGLSGNEDLLGGICNLTFHTNLGKHGPIGKFKDNYPSGSKVFDSEIRDRRGFGGFFGSYNSNGLSSIGIYVSPTASSEKVVESENVGLSQRLVAPFQ